MQSKLECNALIECTFTLPVSATLVLGGSDSAPTFRIGSKEVALSLWDDVPHEQHVVRTQGVQS
jgi:hypothetical protein